MWFCKLSLLKLVTVSVALEVLMTLVIGGCTSNQYNSEASNPPPLASVPVAPPPPAQPRAKVVKASWYGPGLRGHVTATGEKFNPNSLTAASTNLPLGSVVRVTNPENGRSVKVRINDCGPYVHGRSMDLSKRAAQKLGITHDGVAHLKVTPMKVPNGAEACS
jgi:rare lipoprotein A (peptidoglycan hydrolase)